MKKSKINNEIELIPYRESKLPPGPYLIFAPHPDDETFGMGGTIAKAIQAGINIYIVFVTNGGQGGNIIIRKNEAKKAVNLLGVKNIHFWDLPDRKISDYYNLFLSKFTREVNAVLPKTIFTPSLLDFHPDHRATSFFVCKSLELIKYKIAVWFYEVSRHGEANHLIDITSFVNAKKTASQCYQSQINQINYEEIAIAINQSRALTLPNEIKLAEAFYEIEDSSHLRSFFTQTLKYFSGFR